MFGYLGGGPLPFEEAQPGASFVLAFRALPLILVVSALSVPLFYWRVLPLIVRALSWLLQKSLGVGGAVGFGAAANVFVGMVEAPSLRRPFMARLSRGELFAVRTCGMAAVAGTVLALYAAILGPVPPDALGHLLIAYLDLAALPDGALSPRSRLILTYGLCGFANFGRLGIMIGGLATLVPERRGEVVALGLKSLVAGTIATGMAGAVVGLLEG